MSSPRSSGAGAGRRKRKSRSPHHPSPLGDGLYPNLEEISGLRSELADAAFHRQIALMSRNALFVAVFDTVAAAIEEAAWHGVRETAHCSKNKAIYVGFHRDIAAAVASRDAARAEELMFAHLKHVQDQLLAATAPPPANSRRRVESSS